MRPLARFVRYLDSGLRRYLGSIKVPIPELDGLSTVAKSAYGAALNGDVVKPKIARRSFLYLTVLSAAPLRRCAR